MSARAGLAMLGLMAAVLLIPVAVAPVPPITDYPNHLARMWLLSGGDVSGAMDAFYRIRFDTLTNVGIDLLALTLGRVAGYEAAGRAAVAAAVLLPVIGGALLWRTAHGRWHPWILAFGLLAWGQNVLDAFLNFQIGLGLAMLFAAAEPVVTQRSVPSRVLLRIGFGAVVLLAHPFGLLFYATLVAALILGPRLYLFEATWLRQAGARLALAAASFAAIGLVFLLAVPSLPGTQERSGLGTLGLEVLNGFGAFADDPARKLMNAAFAVRAYNNRADAIVLAVLAVPVVISAVSRQLFVHSGLALIAALHLATYLLCPGYLLGAYWVDTRFAVMFLFTAVLAVTPSVPGLAGWGVACLLALAVAGRTAEIGTTWAARQADVAAVAQALSAVPEGAAVLPLNVRLQDRSLAPPGRYTVVGEDSFRHLPALALPWRHAFVATIFAARGKQPIEVLPPWVQIAEPNGGQLGDVHALDDGAPDAMGLNLAPYLALWRTRFDYALVVNADMPDRYGPWTPPPALTLVRDAGFARLYRITRE